MSKYAQVPLTVLQNMQLNAGILVSTFNPTDGSFSRANILGATTGGVSAKCTPKMVDDGTDMDNVPEGVMDLQRIVSYEPRLTGTFLTVNSTNAPYMVGAADVDINDSGHFTPRHQLTAADFKDVWFIGDYSDKTGTVNGGFVAVHMKNSLNTDGFSWQTTKDGKGQFAVNFRAFYDIDDVDTVPFEVYVRTGQAEAGDFALAFNIAEGSSAGYMDISGMSPTPGAGESYVYQTGYSLRNIYAGDVLLGTAWTAWNGTDEIESESGMDVILAIIVTATGVATHGGRGVVVVLGD